MCINVIGIDFSKDNSKCGIAFAEVSNNSCKIFAVGTQKEIPIKTISPLIKTKKCILAVDAPLGWPKIMGTVLENHVAGQYIEKQANSLFRRKTDDFVYEKTGKRSLDVGADKIARTAHGALNLINTLRQQTNLPIPLAWDHKNIDGTKVIEVYPAATLIQYGHKLNGYKKKDKDGCNIRKNLLKQFPKNIIIDRQVEQETITDNDNVFDAVLCIIAGFDFLQGNAYSPAESNATIDCVKKEGWIWFRNHKNQ